MSSFPDVRGVLFDLDGTLLDTQRLILVSFRHAVETVLGKSMPDELLMAKVGQPLTVQMWDFTDDQEVHDELLAVYRDYNARVHDDLIRIFPGVRGLATFGLDGAFDLLIGSDDCAAHKPDPGPVLQGCRQLGLRPEECAYVGDSPFDLQAGRGAGCPTAAVLWGMFPEEVLLAEKPEVACRNVEELRGCLL